MSEPAEHAALTSVATALIPAGIPAENTPDAWKALHADMLVDDKIKALAEHFGCSTHFRRMLKSESAALEVGTAVMVWWAVDGLQSGQIGAVNTDGTFVIHYDDDGQSQATVGLAVRLCALLCRSDGVRDDPRGLAATPLPCILCRAFGALLVF